MEQSGYVVAIKHHLVTAYLLSEEKAETMLPVFLTTLLSHMERLNSLAQGGDLEQLGLASHAVKGALLNVGLTDLAETAYTLETHCRSGNGSFDYLTEIDRLRSTIRQISEAGNCAD